MDGGEQAEDEQRDAGDAPLLAALRRACRQRLPAPGPAALWWLAEHLGLARRSTGARDLPRRLAALEQRGLVAAGREHSVAVWSLTAAGEQALRRAGPQALPESPRRREWRQARAAAAQELPRFRARLAATLARAEQMLAAGEDPTRAAPSGPAWLALGRELHGDCSRLGSAWHCLHEWPEPDEERPADDRLAALRNVRLWREPD